MKKTLSKSDKSIMKGNIFLSGITASVALIICCAICFTGVTWAWFTAGTAVRTSELVSAYCEITVEVTNQQGNIVPPGENGKYSFDENTLYTVKVTARGTATKGFATFTVDGVTYNSVYLNPQEEESITFDVFNYYTLSDIISDWGEIPSDDPVYDRDPRFIRFLDNTVKLMPADGNATVMIERAGKVETFCAESIDGFNNPENADADAKAQFAPYGVQSVEEAYSTIYGYEKGSYDNTWFVYGLGTDLTEDDLADYITVSGGGRYEVTGLKRGMVVTGTVITVYDTKGTAEDLTDDEIAEQFHVVIFGDVDCDGDVNSLDATEMNDELARGNTTWAADKPYIVRAANIKADSEFNSDDVIYMNNYIAQTYALDQTAGRAFPKSNP